MNPHIMEIEGDWDLGYVLDWHIKSSEFLGHNEFGRAEFNTIRTDIGEAIYQLKYRQDQSKIQYLADIMVSSLRAKFKSASFVVPMPPSKVRVVQPALELASNVSKKMELPFFENILLKNGTTLQMKDIASKEERIEALMECFYINDSINNAGSWDVLVIDDVFSSGASFSAATRALKNYKKVSKVFVAAFSRTK